MHEPKLYEPTKKRPYYLICYYTSSESGTPKLKKVKRSSKEKAEEEYKRVKKNFEQFGHRNILTEDQIGDYRRAKQLLAAANLSKSVSEAVAEWIAFQPTSEDYTVSAVVERYLASPKHTAKRPETRKAEQSMLKRFEKEHGEKWAKQITYAILEAYIDSLGVGLVARDNHRRLLKMFFKWGADKRRGYIPTNPAADLESEGTPEKEKPYLKVKDVEAIFRNAEEHDPGLLASLALSFFAGIRPMEIQRLSATNIDLNRKQIFLTSSDTKTGEGRTLTGLPDNLWDWLHIFTKDGKPIVERGDLNKRRKKVFDAVGLEMQNSIGRHTFASYGLAAENFGLEKTSKILGHSSHSTTTAYYSNRNVLPEDAEKYFRIKPSKETYEHKRRTKINWPHPVVLQQWLDGGMTNNAIGTRVGVSEAAVRKHRIKHGL